MKARTRAAVIGQLATMATPSRGRRRLEEWNSGLGSAVPQHGGTSASFAPLTKHRHDRIRSIERLEMRVNAPLQRTTRERVWQQLREEAVQLFTHHRRGHAEVVEQGEQALVAVLAEE